MKYIGYVLVILFAIILLMPLIWMISGSFQPSVDMIKVPPHLITSRMGFFNYQALLKYDIFRWTLNSVYISVACTALSIVINLFAGYAFAKKKFRGKEIIFTAFLLTMIIPGQITLIPSFLIIRNLKLYNTFWAVILPSGMSGFIVYLFRQYIEKIPDEFFAMATIDGCNELQLVAKILIPLSLPIIATVGIMGFILNWNNFLWQMIVLSKESMMTVPLGIKQILHQETFGKLGIIPEYGIMMAGAVYSFLPMLLVFIAGQRYYLKGLFGGGLKG